MEKANKRIIYEGIAVQNSYINERDAYFTTHQDGYTTYHSTAMDQYSAIGGKINEILGYPGGDLNDFAKYVSTITLTPEQRKALSELRRNPWFKKATGEIALQQKSELEKVLGAEISLQGMAFGDENGVSYAMKTEQQLDQELNNYSDKLSQLLKSGVITEEQYDIYDLNLDIIYEYYISQSKGEQIPLKKRSDAEYESIEEQAYISGNTLDREIDVIDAIRLDDHNELQELQSQHGGMRR